MKTIPIANVKAHLSDYLDECRSGGPIVISRNGKAIGVLLVPVDDDDLERLLLARSPGFQAMLDRSRRSIEDDKGLSESAFWKAARERRQRRGAAVRRKIKRGA